MSILFVDIFPMVLCIDSAVRRASVFIVAICIVRLLYDVPSISVLVSGSCNFDNFARLVLFNFVKISCFCYAFKLVYCSVLFLLQLAKVLSLFVILSFSVPGVYFVLYWELTAWPWWRGKCWWSSERVSRDMIGWRGKQELLQEYMTQNTVILHKRKSPSSMF